MTRYDRCNKKATQKSHRLTADAHFDYGSSLEKLPLPAATLQLAVQGSIRAVDTTRRWSCSRHNTLFSPGTSEFVGMTSPLHADVGFENCQCTELDRNIPSRSPNTRGEEEHDPLSVLHAAQSVAPSRCSFPLLAAELAIVSLIFSAFAVVASGWSVHYRLSNRP